MNSLAVIAYISKSLRMKICKRLLIEVADIEVNLEYIDEHTLSIIISFRESTLSLVELFPGVAEEGFIEPPYQIYPHLKNECIVDILIVDDIEFNISVLRRLLEGLETKCACKNKHRKYVIHAAGSGKEALELVYKQNTLGGGYRLIVMDCLMPEIDGWETCVAIHELYEQKRVRILPYILAYSAFDSREDVIKSQKSGMCGHLSKPCTQEDLCQAISQWITKSIRTQ